MRNLKTTLSHLLQIAFTLFLVQTHCEAQWSPNPVVNNAIITGWDWQGFPNATTDGNDGAIIVFRDIRNGFANLYAQHIDAQGVLQWTNSGVPICVTPHNQDYPEIVPDGNGGAIIGWFGRVLNVGYEVYAQKINAAGVVQWSANGVPLDQSSGFPAHLKMTTDGSGGAIITWEHNKNGTKDIFAQRINSAGVAQWTTNGVSVCVQPGIQAYPAIVADGSGGAVIAWEDERNAIPDIYAQRIDASGNMLWTANGVPVCTAAGTQTFTTITADGSGGAIVAWLDARSGTYTEIYAQRVNAGGAVQWIADGLAVCNAISEKQTVACVSDGNGGAIMSWTDARSGVFQYDIFAQRINGAGTMLWTANGVPISTAMGTQDNAVLVADSYGGAIITWHDVRNANNDDIYAQRIDANGAVQWVTNGLAVSSASNIQQRPKLVLSGNTGAIVVWQDSRNPAEDDIFAQRIYPNGVLCTIPGVHLGPDTTQCQGSLSLDAGNGGMGSTFAWSTGSGSQTITVSSSGIYHVTVTTIGGCQAADTIMVTMLPLPTVSYNEVQTHVCDNAPPLTLSPGTPAGGTYAGTGVSGNIFTPSIVPAGTYTIIYHYTDGNGCVGTDTSAIVVDPCTGIAPSSTNDIVVSPNPSTGFVRFKSLEKVTEIMLLNVMGESTIWMQCSSNDATLDLSNLANGIYLYTAITESGIFSQGKIILCR